MAMVQSINDTKRLTNMIFSQKTLGVESSHCCGEAKKITGSAICTRLSWKRVCNIQKLRKTYNKKSNNACLRSSLFLQVHFEVKK
jgi:hypothetical protein